MAFFSEDEATLNGAVEVAADMCRPAESQGPVLPSAGTRGYAAGFAACQVDIFVAIGQPARASASIIGHRPAYIVVIGQPALDTPTPGVACSLIDVVSNMFQNATACVNTR